MNPYPFVRLNHFTVPLAIFAANLTAHNRIAPKLERQDFWKKFFDIEDRTKDAGLGGTASVSCSSACLVKTRRCSVSSHRALSGPSFYGGDGDGTRSPKTSATGLITIVRRAFSASGTRVLSKRSGVQLVRSGTGIGRQDNTAAQPRDNRSGSEPWSRIER